MSTWYTPTSAAGSVSPLQTVSNLVLSGNVSLTTAQINQYYFVSGIAATIFLPSAPAGSWISFRAGASTITIAGNTASNTTMSFIVNSSGSWVKM